jgi:hypothetical protein
VTSGQGIHPGQHVPTGPRAARRPLADGARNNHPGAARPTVPTGRDLRQIESGYLRCAQVMVNYTALGEASPAAVSRCACASIAYGVRWSLGYETPIARNSRDQHANKGRRSGQEGGGVGVFLALALGGQRDRRGEHGGVGPERVGEA